MVKFIRLSFLILISMLVLQNLTFGQGVHEHDGFFLRFQAGPGYGQMTMDKVLGSEMEFSGAGGEFVFQIGGTVGNNLILFGEFGGFVIQDPTVKIGGQELEVSDLKSSTSDFGAGLTYYFMPSNIYLSGSLLAARATLEFADNKSSSDIGFGFRFSVGKEWWVSDDWGIGVAIFGYYSSVPDKEPSESTISSSSFGVVFSATYN